jgi:hypothetical protein
MGAADTYNDIDLAWLMRLRTVVARHLVLQQRRQQPQCAQGGSSWREADVQPRPKSLTPISD